MWRIVILLGIIRAQCAVSISSPVEVVFSSVNLRNVLQWRRGNDTPAYSHFTVQYAIYGDTLEGSGGRKVHWRRVWHCTDVARTWCDLTNETWDTEQGYYARVRAAGRGAATKWMMTQRFDPKSDTTFGPPLVSMAIEQSSAIITLKGPMRYQLNNHTTEVSMRTLYPQMTYNLSVRNVQRNQTRHFPLSSSRYEYRLMDHNTEYCFTASARFLSMPTRCQPSEWHCITTPPDPLIGQLQKVVVGIIVAAVCICVLMVAGYLLGHYLMGKGQHSPKTLELLSSHPPPLFFSPENSIVVTVMKNYPQILISGRMADPLPYQLQLQHLPLALPPLEHEDEFPVDYGFAATATGSGGGATGWGGREDDPFRDGNWDNSKPWNVTADGEGVGSRHNPEDSPHPNSYNPQRPAVMHMLGRIQREYRENSAVAPSRTVLRVDQSSPGSPLMDEVIDKGSGGKKSDGRDRQRMGGVEEEEKTPLIPVYTAQHFENRSDSPPDDYSILKVATPEMGNEGEDERGEVFSLDPTAPSLAWSRALMELNTGGKLVQRHGGVEEGTESKCDLRLQDVLLRQSFEEESMDDIFEKWNLVIPMNDTSTFTNPQPHSSKSDS